MKLRLVVVVVEVIERTPRGAQGKVSATRRPLRGRVRRVREISRSGSGCAPWLDLTDPLVWHRVVLLYQGRKPRANGGED